jgi:hypothetical protein
MHLAAVGAQYLGAEPHFVRIPLGQRGHGRMAVAAQRREKQPLGADPAVAGAVVDRVDQQADILALPQDVDADRALCRRRQPVERHAGLDPHSDEARFGQYDRIDLATLDLGEPGLDVSPDRHRPNVGPPGE